jgi:putative ABC transport system permease protein
MKLFDIDNWQEIWATITRNKFRSVATGFGGVWGLFMVIVLLALGNKLQQSIMAQVDGFATNSVFLWTGRTSEPFQGYRKGRWWTFRNSDVALVRERARSVDIVSPAAQGWSGDRNVVRGMKSGTYSVSGIYPDFYRINTVNQDFGRLINEVDIADRRKVCVIGKKVYETLFEPGESVEGKFIRVNGIYFQVVGIISPHSNASIFGPVDEAVHIPFTTNQMLYARSDEFYFMALTAKPGYAASQVEEEVKAIIRTAHDISPTDKTAVGSVNIEHQFKMFNMIFTGVNVLMWIVGLGALFSGIIGISNIMLVTVRERMREIGVRRALGAKPWNIIIQIMSESFVLTAIAGMGGFLLGIAVSLGVDKINIGGDGPGVYVSTEPIISFNLALVAMVVLMLSGVAAGLLPAWRALKIKAIDAIRDE